MAAILWPTALLAHAKLVRSEPGAGSTLSASPHSVRLEFSEAPAISWSSLKLETSAGDTLAIGNLRADPRNSRILIGDIPVNLDPGDYRILWTVAARDGHPTHGSITFTMLDSQAATAAAVAEPPPEENRPLVDSAAMADEHDSGTMAIGGALAGIGARWLSFLSIFLLIGAVTFRFFVLRQMSANDIFTAIASAGAATLGITAAAGVILAAALKLSEESAIMPDVSFRSMMFGSLWGWSILAQLLLPIVAAAALRAAQKQSGTSLGRGWILALATSAALAIAPSLGSHAAASNFVWIQVPVDVIHIAAGSMWLGTLAVIVIVGIPAALKTPDSVGPGVRVTAMINVFSPLALACGATIVVTGIVATLFRLPAVNALWTTPYGVILFRKLMFVAILLVAGAWNWKRMKPRLAKDNDITPVRASATIELLLAMVVLGITAILVALELP